MFGEDQDFGIKIWQMNRSAKRLLIVFRMVSVWQITDGFAKFTKLSQYMVEEVMHVMCES